MNYWRVITFNLFSVWYEPTDVHKASKPLRKLEYRSAIAYTSPNLAELKQMVNFIQPGLHCLNEINLNKTIEEIEGPLIEACRPLLDTMQLVMITLGKLGMTVNKRIHKGVEFIDSNPNHLKKKLFSDRKTRKQDKYVTFGSMATPTKWRNYGHLLSCTCSGTYSECVRSRRLVIELINRNNHKLIDSVLNCSLAAGFISGILKGWDQDKCAALGLRAAACSLQNSPAVPNSISDLLVWLYSNSYYSKKFIFYN